MIDGVGPFGVFRLCFHEMDLSFFLWCVTIPSQSPRKPAVFEEGAAALQLCAAAAVAATAGGGGVVVIRPVRPP